MNSLILNTMTRILLPLLLIFSVFLLLRGHYLPGGGFVGGLAAAVGFALYEISAGKGAAQRALRLEPLVIMAIGLVLAVISAVAGLLMHSVFFQACWLAEPVPLLGYIGTPLTFDVGVYLAVLGGTLTIIFSLGVGE